MVAYTPLRTIQRIYCLGPEGTFSERAALKVKQELCANQTKAPVVCHTDTILESIQQSTNDPDALCVVPIENADSGTVHLTQDALTRHPLEIVLEVSLKVRLSLLSNQPLKNLQRVYAQPVAWEQCYSNIQRYMHKPVVNLTRSNAESGIKLLSHPITDGWAAVCTYEFGLTYPDMVRADDVQDHPNNVTRFVVLQLASTTPPLDFRKQKTALLIEPERDRPGLLYDILQVFKEQNLNLCRLESRPARPNPWTYIFYIDLTNSAGVEQALQRLQQGSDRVRILGSFDTL